MTKSKYFIIPIVVILIAFIFVSCGKADSDAELSINENGIPVTLYKSPTCGCCGEYSIELANNGYNVEVIKTEDMKSIRDKYGISEELESCHTMVFEDYFVEGHMPFEVIDKLLTEKPDIDGITLPDMPSGTVGMPGEKREEWIIYAIKDNQIFEYIRI